MTGEFGIFLRIISEFLSTSQRFLKELIVNRKLIGLYDGHDARYKLRGATTFHEAQGTAKNSIAAIAKLFLSACALVKVKLIDTFPAGVHDVETILQTQVQARGNRFIACIGHEAFQNTFCHCKILQYVVPYLKFFITQVNGEGDYTPLEMATQVVYGS